MILSHIGVVVLARPFVGLRPLVVTIATFLSLHYSYSSQILGLAYNYIIDRVRVSEGPDMDRLAPIRLFG